MLKHVPVIGFSTLILFLIFSFRVLTLILTFLCYMNYHMTRKAFSAVKVSCSYMYIMLRTIVLNGARLKMIFAILKSLIYYHNNVYSQKV